MQKKNKKMDDRVKNYNQRILKKLISEEYIAWNLYMQCIWVAETEISMLIQGIFTEIANDEFSDHMKKLIDFAKAYDLDVPYKMEQYEKYADENLVKLMPKIKKSDNISYYLDLMIEAEKLAIVSYEEAIDKNGLNDDLYSLILNIYYEECGHLNDLNTVKFTAECEYGNPDLIIN